jgi:hypothetical protein
MTVFLRPIQLLAHSWHKTKISDIILLEKGLKTIKLSSVLEPQNPTLNPPYDSIDHISSQPTDLRL